MKSFGLASFLLIYRTQPSCKSLSFWSNECSLKSSHSTSFIQIQHDMIFNNWWFWKIPFPLSSPQYMMGNYYTYIQRILLYYHIDITSFFSYPSATSALSIDFASMANLTILINSFNINENWWKHILCVEFISCKPKWGFWTLFDYNADRIKFNCCNSDNK